MERSPDREVIEALEDFCCAFADRDVDALIGLVGGHDLVVVTSEESVLRGRAEFKEFLDGYLDGPITYSWEWDRYDLTIAG